MWKRIVSWIYIMLKMYLDSDALYILRTNLIMPSHECASNTPTTCKNSIFWPLASTDSRIIPVSTSASFNPSKADLHAMLQVILLPLQSDLRVFRKDFWTPFAQNCRESKFRLLNYIEFLAASSWPVWLTSKLPGVDAPLSHPGNVWGSGRVTGQRINLSKRYSLNIFEQNTTMKREAHYKKRFEMNKYVPARDMLDSTWKKTSNVLTQFCSILSLDPFPWLYMTLPSFPDPAFSLLDSINWASSWLTWDSWLLSRKIAGGQSMIQQHRKNPTSPNCDTSVQCCWYI